jgi:hypothetical protein
MGQNIEARGESRGLFDFLAAFLAGKWGQRFPRILHPLTLFPVRFLPHFAMNE